MDEADCSFCRQTFPMRHLASVAVHDGRERHFCANCLAGVFRLLGTSAEDCAGCRSVHMILAEMTSLRHIRRVLLAHTEHDESCPLAALVTA